jgi:hypothetical protein
MKTRTQMVGTLAAFGILSHAVAAQQPNASAPAFGMGGNYTALARGYDAVAWNPALLGLSDNPTFSFTLAAAGGFSGLHPIDLSSLKPFEGQTIPLAVKEQWLADVTTRGGEHGRVDGGATLLALGIGPVALQVGSSAYAAGTLSPDAFEALMFGNAGRTGTPRNLTFAGSTLEGAAFTTGALSFGLPTPIELPLGELALGITGKYVMGHAMARAQDDGSALTTSGVTLRFPIVYADPSDGIDQGHGMGFDIGAAYSLSRVTVSATLQNVMNSFAWDTTAMRVKMGTASFDGSASSADLTVMPYDSAPPTLRRAIADARFAKVFAAGAAFYATDFLTVTVDVRHAAAGMTVGARDAVGAGAELRVLGFLPLRAGLSRIDGGFQIAGGAGISVFGFEMSLSAARRTTSGGGSAAGVMLGVVSMGGGR